MFYVVMDFVEYDEKAGGFDNTGTDENPILSKRSPVDPIFSEEHIYKSAYGKVALKVDKEIPAVADKELLLKEKVDKIFQKIESEFRDVDNIPLKTFPIE